MASTGPDSLAAPVGRRGPGRGGAGVAPIEPAGASFAGAAPTPTSPCPLRPQGAERGATQGSLLLAGRRLETAWWGEGPDTAPTLVLLHEGLGCVALWRDFPDALTAATGCGVFAYSRFGYGGSDPVTLPRPGFTGKSLTMSRYSGGKP